MTQTLKDSIARAVQKADENDIPQVEVWVGRAGFIDIKNSISLDSDVTQETNERFFYRGMRVRQMADDGVRVGETTCEFGPGVT